jgi:hypothetical protein
MKLSSAISLTAWLWDQHPDIVLSYYKQLKSSGKLGALGCCLFCSLDAATCGVSLDSSSSIADSDTFSDPDLSISDSDTLGPVTSSSCEVNVSIGGTSSIDSITQGCELSCIKTLSSSDLTPVDTSYVTGVATSDEADAEAAIDCASSASALSSSAGSTALKQVASSLTAASAVTALATAASNYFKAAAASSSAAAAQAQLQAAVVSSQLSRAVTGSTAAPIKYVANTNGTTTAVVSTKSGDTPLTTSLLRALTPSTLTTFLAQYGTWVLVAGAAGFVLYAATRKKHG